MRSIVPMLSFQRWGFVLRGSQTWYLNWRYRRVKIAGLGGLFHHPNHDYPWANSDGSPSGVPHSLSVFDLLAVSHSGQ